MGRMSKIRVAFDAKDDSSRQRRLEGRSTKTTSTSTHTDDLKDDIHTKPRHKLAQFSSLPRKKKTPFCRIFPSKHLELSKVFHIFALRKDIRQAHSFTSIHTNNRVFFEHDEIFISKGRFNDDDRRRETKDWNISRHRHEHQP